ncbi:hypothetical protein GJV26_21195 [Massilia dura]|uniref:DUF5666 domain-containing protein n=1 Tax=Pseudoduganella dura TaxID=321982 RepID=A0A6I3XNY0_9BURK|nr:DUF6152 family protein [Pseudoduganella dura]MUI14962.1 hypothetical protein [Pseudoduganella dura]GGY01256.1 hypothetical protein GCM10007386_35290 [Pseudoduganella dura]
MKRTFVALTLTLTLGAAATAFAHHGWSEYDADKPLTLTGTIATSGYTQPHGYVELKTADKTWHVVLAPPSRMESRGLAKEALAAGGQATVYGYPHRSKGEELRAERITIKDKTVELR